MIPRAWPRTSDGLNAELPIKWPAKVLMESCCFLRGKDS